MKGVAEDKHGYEIVLFIFGWPFKAEFNHKFLDNNL